MEDQNASKGSFGQVYEATDESGETVAIKVLDRSLLKRKHRGPAAAKALEAVTREIAVMKKIEDPGVVLLFDVFEPPFFGVCVVLFIVSRS